MEPFIGQIQAFGFDFAPKGWAKCDGAFLLTFEHPVLYSLLGTRYGGDGLTTFGLPDLRGRSLVGAGQLPGLENIDQGTTGGAENVTLKVNHLPSHNHTATLYGEAVLAESGNPNNKMLALSDQHIYARKDSNPDNQKTLDPASIQVANTGDGQSFNVRNPYLGINFCIALDGQFPPRN